VCAVPCCAPTPAARSTAFTSPPYVPPTPLTKSTSHYSITISPVMIILREVHQNSHLLYSPSSLSTPLPTHLTLLSKHPPFPNEPTSDRWPCQGALGDATFRHQPYATTPTHLLYILPSSLPHPSPTHLTLLSKHSPFPNDPTSDRWPCQGALGDATFRHQPYANNNHPSPTFGFPAGGRMGAPALGGAADFEDCQVRFRFQISKKNRSNLKNRSNIRKWVEDIRAVRF
jgi:hypothetical protein